jgi:predicted transcriptional regulator
MDTEIISDILYAIYRGSINYTYLMAHEEYNEKYLDKVLTLLTDGLLKR